MLSIRLGGTCQVDLNGLSAAPMPSESAMVLLCGLASRQDSWSGRDELGRRLYADADRERRQNALRQCLYRLRHWIGDDFLEFENDRIRLRPGSWKLDLTIDGEEPAHATQIAPGIEHPWIDELRSEWSPEVPSQHVPLMRGFIESVVQIAQSDPDTARGMFVSAADMADELSLHDYATIAGAVRPRRSTDPHAAEFRLMNAWMNYKNGLFEEAIRQACLARRCNPKREVQADIATLLFFAAIERCDDNGIAQARQMLLDTQLSDNIDQIEMCLYWNIGNIEEGIAARKRAAAKIHHYSRIRQAAFWLNAAYFAADIKDLAACREAHDEAMLLMRPPSDSGLQITLLNVQAKMHLIANDAFAAHKIILDAKVIAKRFGRMVHDVYLSETQGEVSAVLGHHERARIEWGAFLGRRRTMGAAVPKRLKHQQMRVVI